MQRLHSRRKDRKGRGETERFGLNGRINHEYMELVLWKFANSADENASLSKEYFSRVKAGRRGGRENRPKNPNHWGGFLDSLFNGDRLDDLGDLMGRLFGPALVSAISEVDG